MSIEIASIGEGMISGTSLEPGSSIPSKARRDQNNKKIPNNIGIVSSL